MRGSAGVQERVGRGEETRDEDVTKQVRKRNRSCHFGTPAWPLASPSSRQKCNCLLCHTKMVLQTALVG